MSTFNLIVYCCSTSCLVHQYEITFYLSSTADSFSDAKRDISECDRIWESTMRSSMVISAAMLSNWQNWSLITSGDFGKQWSKLWLWFNYHHLKRSRRGFLTWKSSLQIVYIKFWLRRKCDVYIFHRSLREEVGVESWTYKEQDLESVNIWVYVPVPVPSSQNNAAVFGEKALINPPHTACPAHTQS